MEMLTDPLMPHIKTDYNNLPQDLYIPPDALEVFLETFEGPLDLLLYLIRRQNIDILNIPIAEITRQYIAYIELMKELQLDLAAEYLVMAATLAHIKSRMLLPKSEISGVDEEDDPRAELIRKLQEYEQYKLAALKLDELPRKDRDFFAASIPFSPNDPQKILPELHLEELLLALNQVLQRIDHQESHHIKRERLSVQERMTRIMSQLNTMEFTPFINLFDVSEGRQGIIVTFIAILELIKEAEIEVVQSKHCAPIYIRLKGMT